jgi:hypothetical protein
VGVWAPEPLFNDFFFFFFLLFCPGPGNAVDVDAVDIEVSIPLRSFGWAAMRKVAGEALKLANGIEYDHFSSVNPFYGNSAPMNYIRPCMEH